MKFDSRIFLILALICAVYSAHGSKLYRWTDEQGNIHYSDKVPPEHATRQRARLNQYGVAVEHIEAAKTQDDIAREQEIARLRAQQQLILDEQKARDRVLLNTFRSEDDLILARNNMVNTLDSKITLTKSTLPRLTGRLAEMQANAASLERQGQRVSANLLRNIESTRRQIESGYAAIVQNEQERETITARFDADLTRFRELKNQKSTTQVAVDHGQTERKNLVDTLITCDERTTCQRYWVNALEFARMNSTTPVQVSSERIMVSAPPVADEDLSLTVSRISAEGGSEYVFLDIRCRDSLLGREFCLGPKVAKVREEFRIKTMLGND